MVWKTIYVENVIFKYRGTILSEKKKFLEFLVNMAAGWINIYYLYWPASQGWKVYRTDILLGLGYSYASRLNNINYREEGNLKFVLKFLLGNE